MTAALVLVLLAGSADLDAVKAHLAKQNVVRADFVQKRKWVALKDTLVSSGTVEFDKSGKLAWHTLKPTESELLLEGSTATMRVPKLKTSQTLDLSADPGLAAVFSSLRAVVRADFASLEKDFAVAQVADKGAKLSVKLTPKNEALTAVVKSITLSFNEQLDLSKVVLEEAGGDSTEIAFLSHANG